MAPTTRLFSLLLAYILISPIMQAQDQETFSSDLQTEKKPWTNTNFLNDPNNFQFAIVTDRTGSPREGVFEDAVKKLNWLQPEFVMSVGDLIRGTKDSVKLMAQWGRHFQRIEPLEMPFFHIAGNHDVKAADQSQINIWNSMFGAIYYSFRYKDVLFLGLFTNDAFQTIGQEQVDYIINELEKNQDVRWTMLFMHHPLWRYPHTSNFEQIEAKLKGRKYTVFAGHQHHYHHSVRQEANYYVLATTGGGSSMLGNSFGGFDHVTWVTMADDGPRITNLRLDGILSHDVANEETQTLGRELVRTVRYDTDVFVDNPEKFKKGKALITYTNNSELPVYLDAKLFHNHYVQVHPAEMSIEIPAKSRKSIELSLEANEPFNLNKAIILEMDGNIGYKLDEYPDLKLSGTTMIRLEVSDFDMIANEEVEFVDNYEVEMIEALPGTKIHYTLDGSEPTPKSAVYEKPFSVNKATTVKAALFTDDNMHSSVDMLKLSPVKPGKGVLCKYYEYDTRRGTWYWVPDFVDLEPTTVKVSQNMDPAAAGPREQFYGVVYKGYMDFPESGEYKFTMESDEGAILFIDGEPVVVDAVKHKAREAYGNIELSAGKHLYEVHFYEHKKGVTLNVSYEMPSGKKDVVSIDKLSFAKDTEEAKLPEGYYDAQTKAQ